MSALAAVLARLRALDPQFNPAQIAATRDIYAPLVEMPDPQVCVVQRDLAYGPDERHRLDIFTPAAAASALRTVYKGTRALPMHRFITTWVFGPPVRAMWAST